MKLLLGGSPCTYWSIAQQPDKRETTASGLGWDLFQNYVIALEKFQSDYFIYENNKSMSKEIRAQITAAFGFEPVLINSALVSAQNRQRLYWVGKRSANGTYSRVDIEQPIDRGILLRDVLETGQDLTSNPKSYAVTTRCNGAIPSDTICKHRRNMVAEPVQNAICIAERGRYNLDGTTTQRIEPRTDGKTNAITTVQKDNQVAKPVRVGCMPSPDGTLKNNQSFRVYSEDGKSVNLTAGGGGAGGKTGLYAILNNPHGFNKGGVDIEKAGALTANGKYQDNHHVIYLLTQKTQMPVYAVTNGIITIKGKSYPIKLADGFYTIRKLTVKECMRLQTVPEWYQFPVSNSQAYKMLGNGWTVEVIKHIMQHLDGITTEPLDVLSMYDGMSCGLIALTELGGAVWRYRATEIDKYAIQTACHNFSNIQQIGDAFQVRNADWS